YGRLTETRSRPVAWRHDQDASTLDDRHAFPRRPSPPTATRPPHTAASGPWPDLAGAADVAGGAADARPRHPRRVARHRAVAGRGRRAVVARRGRRRARARAPRGA